MEIRAATESDAYAIAKLWTEAYVTLGVAARSKPYTEATSPPPRAMARSSSPTGRTG